MEKRTLPPVVTYALCALSVIITLANQTSSATSMSPWAGLGHYADNGAFDVWNGHYGILITSIFIHADFRAGMGVTHLLFNLFWLYYLGTRLEKSIGSPLTLGLVVASAFVSSACELAWSGTVGVGLSGVVYAIFAFMWAGRDKYSTWKEVTTRDNLMWLAGWAILCVVTTHFGWLAIATGAHVGGAVFGYCVGMVVWCPGERTKKPPWLPLKQWLWAAPIAVQLIVFLVASSYAPWTWQWNYYNGVNAFNGQDYGHAITWFGRSIEQGGPPAPAWEAVGKAWHNMSITEYKAHNWAAFKYDQNQERTAMARAGKPLPPPPPPTVKKPAAKPNSPSNPSPQKT